jgi:conjugal transfer mating pair stabilization protein TraN
MVRGRNRPLSVLLIICLLHNGIAGVYLATSILFFTPFPAFAEAFLNSGQQGQQLGLEVLEGFTVPSVHTETGALKLNNGLVQGQVIEQKALFQEIEAGSMDEAIQSYGDANALGQEVSDQVNHLLFAGSSHGYAFQTLMGAKTAHPDIYNDPLWTTSDELFSLKNPLFNDLFTGCDAVTDYSEQRCGIDIEQLKTCKKTLKTQSCSVTRVIEPDSVPVIKRVSGSNNSSLTFNSDVSASLFMKASGRGNACPYDKRNLVVDVLKPELIRSVKVTEFGGDSNGALYIDGIKVFDTGGCANKKNGISRVSVDITAYFKTAGSRKLELWGNSKEGDGESIYMRMAIAMAPSFKESFVDFPAGCRSRLFNAWPPLFNPPPFIPTDNLNDQASTKWWRCLDAANSRTVGSITVTKEVMGPILAPILPEPRVSPPAPLCFKAETRVPGSISLSCFKDISGYEVCPQFEYDLEEHSSCELLAADKNCKYVKETCAKEGISPITGSCQEFIVTYDCGTRHEVSCDLVSDGEKTLCDSQIRCLGGECYEPGHESSTDFIKAATTLQVLNQASQFNGCDALDGTCQLFPGEPLECKMADVSILGEVDCCNMPIEGSWIQYMDLAWNSWELADTSVELYALSNSGTITGAWQLVSQGTLLEAPVNLVNQTWNAVTEPFTSLFDSVASMLGEEIGTTLTVEALQNQAAQFVGEWLVSSFGEFGTTIAKTLLTSVGDQTLQQGAYTYVGSMLQSIVSVIGIIYAIYQIAKLVVQLIFQCTEEEVKLNMLKSQRLCTQDTAIGDYCSTDTFFGCVERKLAYCCFSSPFARIFQEQARKQTGKGFGKPENPDCSGFTLNDIAALDFERMNFREWLDMMIISNKIPKNSTVAADKYDLSSVTKGKLPNSGQDSAADRLRKQTEGTDLDKIRQHLLNNL